ncbi:MAG: carbohydrate kinase family protein [Fusicatenibacter sp.]
MSDHSSFLCIGLIMHDTLIQGVPSLPSHWEDTVRGTGVFSDTGGGAANSARTLGRLGASVSILGRIGRDSAGDQIMKTFQQDHVSTNLLIRDLEKPTGIATALVNPNGRRCFATVQGCNQNLCLSDFDGIDFSLYRYVHINGYFQFPALEKDMPELLSRMKGSGCIISFDTASWDPSGKWYESIHPFASNIDYFFGNEAQLCQFSKEKNAESASHFLLRDGVKHVVAKLGENGCTLYTQDMAPIHSSALSVNAVDTTGAGDSFDAAYLLAHSKGWSFSSCNRFANIVAGMNCSKPGATSGVPTYEKAMEKM